jgi:hypothetical protein
MRPEAVTENPVSSRDSVKLPRAPSRTNPNPWIYRLDSGGMQNARFPEQMIIIPPASACTTREPSVLSSTDHPMNTAQAGRTHPRRSHDGCSEEA